MGHLDSYKNPINMDAAADILRRSDWGGYAIPTDGPYPFQWSWDSAIVALGWMRIDEERARLYKSLLAD
ncbi:MAG: hypothetical protein ACR2RD_00575 [Woeseiaceae bacterium]